MYSDGKNYMRYNPGNKGSQHGGEKWLITGNDVDGKSWVGGEDFSGFEESKGTINLVVPDEKL